MTATARHTTFHLRHKGGVHSGDRPPVALLIPSLAGAVIALLPLWYLVDRATERGWAAVRAEVFRRSTLDLLVRSLALTATVTVLAVVIGVSAAWLVERCHLPGRAAWRIALALPLAVPSYLAAFAWIEWQPTLTGYPGAVVVLTLVSYPYVYLPVAAALRGLDGAHDDVARSLGAHTMAAFRRVTLPQIRPTIAAGSLLVALYVLSDFGAVATMRHEVFTWSIFGAYRSGFNPSRAAILASLLVLVALVLVVAEAGVRGRAGRTARVGSGVVRSVAPVRLGRATAPAIAWLSIVVGLGVAFPIVRAIGWIVSYESTDVDLGSVLSTAGSTLWVALLGTLAVMAFAVPLGIAAARYRHPAITVSERSAYVAHALPAIVAAIALAYVGVRVLRPIYQRTPLLVLGYVVLFLPLAVGSVRAAVEQIPRRLDDVARSLGVRSSAVTWRVLIPAARPGLLGGAALVFLTAIKELPLTLTLRPTALRTLPTELWRHTSVSDYANAAPYAIAIVVLGTIPSAIATAFTVNRTARSAA